MGQVKADVTLTLRGFADEIREAIGKSKDDLSWIKLARFGSDRTARGSFPKQRQHGRH